MTPVPPDVESLLLAFLRSHTLLTGITIGSIRPGDLPVPFVLLTRIGGDAPAMARTAPLIDQAVIDTQCWATSQHAAAQLARNARAALYEAKGQHPSGVIARVAPFTGLAEIPDPLAPQGASRYGFALTFTAH